MKFHSTKNSFLLIVIVVSLSSAKGYCQNNNDKSFYGGLNYLTNYMNSDKYRQFSKIHNDLENVNRIYQEALSFFEEDKSEAFFCLTFVFLPYNHINMKVPLLGIIKFPLPSTPQKVFNEKVQNTPKHLFVDSPNNSFGDKDKLAHFFANAFLRYNVSFFNLSEFLGIFVEYFEQGFFMQGEFDRRDLIANHLGEIFAEMVKKNPNAMPSEAFKIYQLLFLRICQ